MFTCLHDEIHSQRQLVTLALHLNDHLMIYSAPVYGRLSHVYLFTAPVGKLANLEVHAEVAFVCS